MGGEVWKRSHERPSEAGVSEMVVARRVACDVGAERVALMLLADGEHYPVRGSDPVLVRLAEQERWEGEGPGTDLFRSRRPVAVADLRAEQRRWPALLSRSAPCDVRTLHLHPLLGPVVGDGQVLGVLGLSRSAVRPFSRAEAAVAARLADLLSLMLQARAYDDLTTDAEGGGGRLDEVFDPTAHVLPLAVGHLMVREGLDEDEALLLLERRASESGRSVHDLARDVVRSGADAAEP